MPYLTFLKKLELRNLSVSVLRQRKVNSLKGGILNIGIIYNEVVKDRLRFIVARECMNELSEAVYFFKKVEWDNRWGQGKAL